MAAVAEQRENGDYVRTAEAARILGVSTKTVSRWARAGKLPHVVTLGGHRRFPLGAVRELAGRMMTERGTEA